jgi:hypothetical protein
MYLLICLSTLCIVLALLIFKGCKKQKIKENFENEFLSNQLSEQILNANLIESFTNELDNIEAKTEDIISSLTEINESIKLRRMKVIDQMDKRNDKIVKKSNSNDKIVKRSIIDKVSHEEDEDDEDEDEEDIKTSQIKTTLKNKIITEEIEGFIDHNTQNCMNI